MIKILTQLQSREQNLSLEAILSTLSKERCNFIIHQTEGLYKWIKEQL